VGVHQDGLVHISAMSRSFIKDPREVVKPGDIVRVKVLEVDVPRKRIALTLRLDDEIGAKPDRGAKSEQRNNTRAPSSSTPAQRKPAQSGTSGGGALAEALRRAAEQKQGKPR